MKSGIIHNSKDLNNNVVGSSYEVSTFVLSGDANNSNSYTMMRFSMTEVLLEAGGIGERGSEQVRKNGSQIGTTENGYRQASEIWNNNSNPTSTLWYYVKVTNEDEAGWHAGENLTDAWNPLTTTTGSRFITQPTNTGRNSRSISIVELEVYVRASASKPTFTPGESGEPAFDENYVKICDVLLRNTWEYEDRWQL
tara:strand:- start:195511 stop:196098 length:588 start_codon:yes stop_codon:yes gene_type:complete